MGKLTKGQLHYWGDQFAAQFCGWTVEERIRVLKYLLSQEERKACNEAIAPAEKAYKDATDPAYKAYKEENINEATQD